MYKGGTNYTPRFAQILRFASLVVPIILFLYGLLIQFNFIQTPSLFKDYGLYLFIFWWVDISVLHFLFPVKSNLDKMLRLIVYHLLVGSYLIFISGMSSPFVGGWFLLMIASYILFSELGFQLSTFAFVFVVIADIIIWNNDVSIVIYDLFVLVAVLFVGLLTLTLSRSKEISESDYNQVKAQEVLQRDRVLTIINNMADAVFSTDASGIISIYNAASLNLLDTNENLDGHKLDDLLILTDKDNQNVTLSTEMLQAKTVVKRDDISLNCADGEIIRLEITYSPIRSSFNNPSQLETNDGFIVMMRDITKAKSLEEERDEFISVVSHELRTPITIAEGTISNAQVMMDHPDITKDMIKDAVGVAHDQIIFLANLVNDLSALSRAERGVADVGESIDVRELVHKMHDKYVDSATAKDLQLDIDIAPTVGNVHVSRLYLEELLQNFLTNAIKYTKKGSVTIIARQNNDSITLAVQDTGIGISKSDQVKVFEKFYRSEDYRTRETSGTGLGLYVAAKLAHKLGTTIQLTSRLDFGSTFSIILPKEKETDKPLTSPSS